MATTGASPSASRIFISYRRESAAYAVGRLAHDLRQHFPGDQVFQDIASIDPGVDFGEALKQGLDTCAAVLVVIDPTWLKVSDRQGRRRLDLPDDWVRHEVAESLRRTGVRVFPVLLDTAMPGAEDLPEPLRPLTRRQAFRLTADHWPHDVAQLVAFLKRVPGLSDAGAREAAEAIARLRAEQEAQRREAEERAAKEEARRVAAAEEARRRADEEARRKSEAEACRISEEEVRRRAAEETAPRDTQPPQARAHRWKAFAGIGAIIGVAALAVFFGIERSPHAPVVSVTPPPAAQPEKPMAAPAATPPAPKVQAPVPAVASRAGEFRDCDQCPQMVTVPRGRFRMGDGGRYAEPRHDVKFARSFAVGRYEVTFDEWDACVAAGGCERHPQDSKGWGRGKRPVIDVSWEDAQAYVAWLSKKTRHKYRLLTEAEWEYAARAGRTTRYPWGDDPDSNRANFGGSGSQWSGKQTAPVGSFEPNAFGLHDMIGNVWEWVQDCWNDSYKGAPADGSAWEAGDCGQRVVRGGSWDDTPDLARAAFRVRFERGFLIDRLGFRVARTL